ncbi:uncharacterized protein [Chironomus tepperi]|uniref:uncharacterized protein n=1 Tax=Chironomus tepperi TaxID=113505 RepID=UPI00391F8EE4
MTEAFDLMSNTIFDNIVNTEDNQDINLDDIWKSDLTSYDIDSIPLLPTLDDFCQVNNIDINAVDSTNKVQEESKNETLHDCMWSGTCVDKTHPTKKKNFRFCANEGDNCEESDMDIETEIMLENNLPADFQALNRNMQTDPASVFQEIIQNASQSSRNYAPTSYPKATHQQFPQLQQTYHNLPVMYQNAIPTKMMEVKNESTNKLIKIESVKFEPVVTEAYQMMPEQHPVPQMFFCNEEPMASQIVPYYPPMKYEPINVMPQFYYPYPPEFDGNGNQICHVNENGYFKNIKITVVDHQNQKQTKKKSQDKRKGTKKTKVKDKKRMADEVCFGEGSKKRPRLRLSTGSDENPIEKRSMHNSMERQRRIGLKNLFVELKEAIPTLDERERVPKVSILREAIAYCQKLHTDEKLLEDLKRKHNKLMTQFHKLHKTMSK